MSIVKNIKFFLKDLFNLDEDKADEKLIIESIYRHVQFKGTNLWTLIFAIFIASIGLNINSIPVIIGAMLISPLMGPIMAIGLSVGINDLELLKRGIKNFAITAFISIATSAIYFSVTPIKDITPELLARTNPSLWDVFIAFFGGLAGIVAGTRKEKSNVVPGVAIATALMPPLCTAGYGLATGNWIFLLGAVYLFFINSLLICLATLLIVKHLKFHKKEFQTRAAEKKVTRYILIIVVITIIPSVYLAYKIVERSIFEHSAKNFVQNEFRFSKTQVINKSYSMDGGKQSIDLLLLGQELPEHIIDSLKSRMPVYGLDTNVMLTIHQGLNARQQIDMSEIKASILEDVFKEEKEADTVKLAPTKLELPIPDIKTELKTLYPDITTYSLSQTVFYSIDSTKKDTITLFTIRSKKTINKNERARLQNWVKTRIHSDSVKLVTE